MSGNMRSGPITERSRLEISPFTPCQTMRAGWMGRRRPRAVDPPASFSLACTLI